MNFEEFKQELLKNPEFKKVYEDKTDMCFKISEDIHKARIMAGLTQAQLAKKIGTQQSSIARVESEMTTPTLSFYNKIAEALGTYLIPPKLASLEPINPEMQTRRYLLKSGMYDIKGNIDKAVEFDLGKANTPTALINKK